MPRFTVGCPPRDSVIGVGNACDSSTYISYYSSANSRGAPDGIFPKNLQTAKKNWLRFPHPKKGFEKSQNLSILGTLRNWITGAEGPTFSLLLVHVAVSSALAPRHDLKKQKGQAKNWATHVCASFENGHPKLFNFQQMVENAWTSTSWRLIDHSCGYCPWYLSKANKNRPVAPLNGVDSGAMAGRLCRNAIVLSSLSLSLVELSFWCWFKGFLYIYIIWFNGHNLAYPPILRYTWGCIPTIVITWLISYNTVYNGI